MIVVFLKDPAKIVADAHRANHNGSKVTMDASLDNANNPFTNSNGTAADNVLKSDDLLLQLTGNYKQNGTDLSPTPGFFNMDNSNGKRPGFDDDDFGPETDVDAVDDVAMSPAEEEKILGEINKEYSNMINNPDEMNKFAEQHQINLGLVHDMQNMQKDEFDVIANAREETPTPPADAGKYPLFCWEFPMNELRISGLCDLILTHFVGLGTVAKINRLRQLKQY